MRRRDIAGVAAIAALVLVSCVPAAPNRARDEADLRAETKRYDEFVQAMDANAIADEYTEDGELVHAGTTIVRGRKRIHAYLAPFDTVVRVLEDASQIDSVRVDGRLGRVFGTYHQKSRVLATHEEVQMDGRFEAEWIRQPSGRWRLRRMSTGPIR